MRATGDGNTRFKIICRTRKAQNQFDRLFERDAHPDADIQDVAQRIGRSIQACGEGAGKQNHQWDFRFTRRYFARRPEYANNHVFA